MITVGILGGSGYVGKKLLQFLHQHDHVSSYKVYGYTTAGHSLLSVFPEFESVLEDQTIESLHQLSFEHDVYFISLPHGEALTVVPTLVDAGKIVIDLGGDYRLNSAGDYEKWYGKKHTSPDLLGQKTYGLADYKLNENPSDLIANPGCYPTATLLSLLPLLGQFNNEILSVSTVAYSGTSGAGKSANADLLLSEMDGNVRAYNVQKHRHQPEIEQNLKLLGFNAPFSFTTHLLPVATGIYATTSVHLKSEISEDEVKNAYKAAYQNSPFVRLRNFPPNLTWVVGTNFCDIHVSVNESNIIITAAIDNLIKGAAGQAIQNMNKKMGWLETAGILKGENNVSVY